MLRTSSISAMILAVVLLVTTNSQGKDKPIEMYVSSLDSIQPNKVVFYTGTFQAVGIDPRRFMPPDSLLIFIKEWATTDPEKIPSVSKGITHSNFIILDIVCTPLFDGFLTGPNIPPEITQEKSIEGLNPENRLAPNSREWRLPVIDPKYLQSGIKRLWKQASELNANAVIEVLCAKGLIEKQEMVPMSPLYSDGENMNYNPTSAEMRIRPEFSDKSGSRKKMRSSPSESWYLCGLAVKIK